MNLPRSVRILVAMAILVLGLAALLLMLTISEATLNIQAHLEQGPPWLRIAWWGLIAGVSLLTTWVLFRVLRNPKPQVDHKKPETTPPPDAADVDAAIEQAESLGADTTQVRQELDELARRRDTGEIYVAIFGEISTGKSALVNALLPDAQADSDVRGGTTRELMRHRWVSPGGDTLVITDMPGTGEADGDLDSLAIDEAKRAHIVVYVTDGDINRAQHTTLQSLLALNKPLLLTLNKTDRYSESELRLLSERLAALQEDLPARVTPVVIPYVPRRIGYAGTRIEKSPTSVCPGMTISAWTWSGPITWSWASSRPSCGSGTSSSPTSTPTRRPSRWPTTPGTTAPPWTSWWRRWCRLPLR